MTARFKLVEPPIWGKKSNGKSLFAQEARIQQMCEIPVHSLKFQNPKITVAPSLSNLLDKLNS